MRRLPQGGMQAVRPADQQSYVVARLLPGAQFVGQRLGGQAGAALVQRHNARVFGNSGLNARALGQHGLFGGFAARARLGFDRFAQQRQFGRKALGVVVKSRLRPGRHFLADGDDDEFHGEPVLKICDTRHMQHAWQTHVGMAIYTVWGTRVGAEVCTKNHAGQTPRMVPAKPPAALCHASNQPLVLLARAVLAAGLRAAGVFFSAALAEVALVDAALAGVFLAVAALIVAALAAGAFVLAVLADLLAATVVLVVLALAVLALAVAGLRVAVAAVAAFLAAGLPAVVLVAALPPAALPLVALPVLAAVLAAVFFTPVAADLAGALPPTRMRTGFSPQISSNV